MHRKRQRPSSFRTSILRPQTRHQGNRTLANPRFVALNRHFPKTFLLTTHPEFYNRFPGRQALIAFAAEKSIPVQQTTAKPWSTDENLFHISYEAGILEDPNTTPPADMWKLTTDPENAPFEPDRITIQFSAGLPVKVTDQNKTYTDEVEIFLALNALGRKHGIGRIDIVENRFIGVKSRGCYESPGATILRAAHIDLEGLTLDRNVRALRDQFVTIELGRILYNGHFFTPEREFVMSAIPASQRTVNGEVRLKLYKGNVIVEGRISEEVSSWVGRGVWLLS
jgi:argininosuccinate synthase